MEKTESLRVRLTAKEAEAFLKVSNTLGVKRSRFLRKLIRELINQQPDLLEQEQISIREMIKLLMNLSRTIKQINASPVEPRCCSTCCQHLSQMQADFDMFRGLFETYMRNTKQRLVHQSL